jgi:hypothetical protein
MNQLVVQLLKSKTLVLGERADSRSGVVVGFQWEICRIAPKIMRVITVGRVITVLFPPIEGRT